MSSPVGDERWTDAVGAEPPSCHGAVRSARMKRKSRPGGLGTQTCLSLRGATHFTQFFMENMYCKKDKV